VKKPVQRGFAWLELLFVLAAMVLAFQLYPPLWDAVLWIADIRNWPRTTWFAANLAILFTLITFRFGPDLYNEWQNRQKRRTIERERRQKQQELKEQRETLERLKRGRERRIY
jgi:TRAP-type C4-dicarboxylate transport system permease small subunit